MKKTPAVDPNVVESILANPGRVRIKRSPYAALFDSGSALNQRALASATAKALQGSGIHGPVDAGPPKQIAEELINLEQGVAMLAGSVANVVERLSPVSRPLSQEPADDQKADPIMPRVQLADRIRNVGAEVFRLRQQINTAIDLLEI